MTDEELQELKTQTGLDLQKRKKLFEKQKEAHGKQKLVYNNTGVMNITKDASIEMLDKLSGIDDKRRIMPLNVSQNITYEHRREYDQYTLQLGDSCFMLPPEFILVNSESSTQSLVTLRQENTQKRKYGHHKRTILVDLVFNGIEQINGYEVEGPEGVYYVDGLRSLLAQFKCTPFLPISNELINSTYGIFVVALQSITISTVQGFPDLMTAQLTLQEISVFPYLELPDVMFRYLIDWDLFRFYYQRLLTEEHEYKKLQSLPLNKEHNRFKISILDSDALFKQSNESTVLDIICDKKIVKLKDSVTMEKDTTNYITWVDSDVDDVHITGFQCGYSNILTNMQLSGNGTPTVQFLGGMDTIYNITFETKDPNVVSALEQCQISNDNLIRNNARLASVGFVKLESELVELTGSLFVMIESVVTNTVPGFPDLYNVQINCIAYDIQQSEKEDLKGFLPFDCDDPEKCGYYDYDEEQYVSDHTHEDQAIEQTFDGLIKKIKQDNYAEWKLRSTVEVYPDLRLPTYKEVNEFITKCNEFRSNNELPPLPYTEYPTNPVKTIHGCHPDNNISVTLGEDGVSSVADLDISGLEYDIYVDPDFYVFYPYSYQYFNQEDSSFYDTYTPHVRSGHTVARRKKIIPDYGTKSSYSGSSGDPSSLIEQYMSVLQEQEGHTYLLGAEGEVSDAQGMMFDCSGLLHYALRRVGAIPNDAKRFIVATMESSGYFTRVPFSERKRGDCLLQGTQHVVAYMGDDRIIHASYSKQKVVEANVYSQLTVCLRPNAFIASENNNTGNNIVEGDIDTSLVGSTNEEKVWNFLKSKGLNDIAASAAMGNFNQESNGYIPTRTENGKPGIQRGVGYGIAQWTYYTRQDDLTSWCPQNNLDYTTLEGQLNFFWHEVQGYTKTINALRNAVDLTETVQIFCDDYEQPGTPLMDKRQQYAREVYEKYANKTIDIGERISGNPNVLSLSELNSIEKAVAAACLGEDENSIRSVAQLIYDRLTDPFHLFGGLGEILQSYPDFTWQEGYIVTQQIEDIVSEVFCEGTRQYPESRVLFMVSDISTPVSYEELEKSYTKLGEAGTKTFWGKQEQGSTVKYVIDATNEANSASQNTTSKYTNVTYEGFTIEDAKRFGMPVLVRSESIMYDDSWVPWGSIDDNDPDYAGEEGLNHEDRIMLSSFCDEYQYSCRGRLVRAFPTYLFCLLDDQAQWYDGRKLWTNYYIQRAAIDIQVHGTNDMPVETATIVVSNTYHNLSHTQGGLDDYDIDNDDEYGCISQWFHKNAGIVLGGLKLTKRLIQLHQVIYNHARLREGARVHLRMGYGSDPLGLATMINGHISDISLGDQISMVVTSDGHELIQHITSTNKEDTNDGWFGLFGLGDDQESSNVIANVLCKRESMINYLWGDWYEGSKYSLEHYGLFFNQSAFGGLLTAAATAGGYALAGAIIGSFIPGPGTLIGAGIGALLGLGTSILTDCDLKFNDLYNGYQEQYDILKNIYKSSYEKKHYIYSSILGADGEQNLIFDQFNMTPWDIFQICTQHVPEYIVKSSYHQFDSRLFYGLPFWMEKYRYDYLNGTAYEECKSASQVHYLDSMSNIIDNQVKVTSKFSHTNIKIMYLAGEDATSTDTLYSDDTIDSSKQKTKMLDTPLVQDALGPDALYEFLGYNIAEEAAERVGVSDLLYGWQQQYQGQIICMGLPGVKAHDHVLLNDSYSNLNGVASVREVVHSFNSNTGFTTSVTLGMVGFDTTGHSGLVETFKNYLEILNCFMSFTLRRKQMYNQYELNLNLYGNLETMTKHLESLAELRGTYNMIADAAHLVGVTTAIVDSVIIGKHMITLARTGKLVSSFTSAFKNIQYTGSILNKVKMFFNAVKGGTAAATGICWPMVVATIVIEVISYIVESVFEWLADCNVVCLLPLLWEGYPFVAGVKDGEKILLMGSNADATEENIAKTIEDN